MPLVYLFVTACALSGLGGALGSIVGNLFGKTGLWTGGVLGGILASVLVAVIARWRHWISPNAFVATTLGTALGFLAAAGIAVNTLSSPIGPILSTSLTGLGALLGARVGGRSATTDPPHDSMLR